MTSIYECTVTGLSAEGGEAGPLNTMPLGWFRVTVERQLLNEKWVHVQQLKQSILENSLKQLPQASDADAQRLGLQIQIDAQYAALEAATPKMIRVATEVYLAPPEQNKDVQDALNVVYEALGLDDAEDDDAGDGESVVGAQPQVESKAKDPEPKA